MSRECLECGESAKNMHPEYPGDVLCDICLISELDQRLESAATDLKEAKEHTGLASYYDDMLQGWF